MGKKWIHINLVGTIDPREKGIRSKAITRAMAFINQHNLKPGEFLITEGLESPGLSSEGGYGQIYQVSVIYWAETELSFTDPFKTKD